MKMVAIAAAVAAFSATQAFAQAPKTTQELRLECDKNPASMACKELEKQGPAPRAGDPTIPGGPGKAIEEKGGGKAGGVTPGGAPATSGGGPRSSQ